MKNWLIWKDPDAGKDWRQGDKGTTEDEMVGWHHQLDGHEFEPALGVGDGQGGLVCCSSWGHKESDMTEWLNWTELKLTVVIMSQYVHTSNNYVVHLKLIQSYVNFISIKLEVEGASTVLNMWKIILRVRILSPYNDKQHLSLNVILTSFSF